MNASVNHCFSRFSHSAAGTTFRVFELFGLQPGGEKTALAFKMSSGNSSFVLEDEELTLDPEVLADIPAESVESLQADESGETKSIAHDIISQV